MSQLDKKLRDLIRHAYDNAPAIAEIMDEAGVSPDDIQTVADLQKLPVTSKDTLVEMHHNNPPFGGFLAVDPNELPRIYVSPGPIFDPQPINPEPASDILQPVEYVGIGKGDRVLNTFTYHLTPAGLLIDEMLRASGATVLPTGPGNTDVQISMMLALGATGFTGQPSYLMKILDACEEKEIPKEQMPLKKALFSAEMYTESQRERFEDEYGMKTTSVYGTADLGFIGYSRTGVEGFRISEGVFIEIVDPTTGKNMPAGERGEVVATLFNKAYPLIRFGTGDLGALGADPLDGGQHLLGLFGRSGGAVKVRGMFLHPNQLMFVLTQFPQINKIQAIVSRKGNDDHLLIKLEMKPGSESEGVEVGQNLQALAQAAVRLRIDEVEIVEPGVIKPEDRTVIDTREWD